MDAARVDSWLWAIRVYKTRSAATTACRAGHVRVNGDKVKAAQQVRIGDELRIRIAGFDRILIVRQLLVKRVGPRWPRSPMRIALPSANPRQRWDSATAGPGAPPSENAATSTSCGGGTTRAFTDISACTTTTPYDIRIFVLILRHGPLD